MHELTQALQKSEAAGGVVKPLMDEFRQLAAQENGNPAAMAAASLRLQDAMSSMNMLQTTVSLAAAVPGKLLRLGSGA